MAAGRPRRPFKKLLPRLPNRMGSRGSKVMHPIPWTGVPPSNEMRLKEGSDFLAVIWSTVAEKVVDTAIQVYHLSPEQAAALRQAFLRGVTYGVEAEL